MPASLAQRAGDGQRFCVFYRAQSGGQRDEPQGRVLYIHPFAEELNKSRRMAALQARALSAAGFDVLQMDLLGCGDSSGDFGDATWQSWVNDVLRGCAWLRDRSRSEGAHSGNVPLWLWGLRAGCLLAAEAASQLDAPCNFLFWQAPASGKLLLQQFLRLKVAGDALGGQARGVMEKMRQQLDAGLPVEIAGYGLGAGLAQGLEQSRLAPPASQSLAPRLRWLELSTREEIRLGPASEKALLEWRQAGFDVEWQGARGPAFWQTSEIEEAPALIAATLAAIAAPAPAARQELAFS